MKPAKLVALGFVCALLCEPVLGQSNDEVLSSRVDGASIYIPDTKGANPIKDW